MSFDYAEIALIVQEALDEFGAAGIVTRKVPGGDYDPGTGTTTPDTEISQNCTAVVFPIDQKLVDGATVLATDEQACLSAVGLVMPKPTEVLTWQGVGFTIQSVKNLAPAGVAVLVEMIVRR